DLGVWAQLELREGSCGSSHAFVAHRERNLQSSINAVKLRARTIDRRLSAQLPNGKITFRLPIEHPLSGLQWHPHSAVFGKVESFRHYTDDGGWRLVDAQLVADDICPPAVSCYPIPVRHNQDLRCTGQLIGGHKITP